MTMSFKERLALAAQKGTQVAPTNESVAKPVEEPKPVSRFAQRLAVSPVDLEPAALPVVEKPKAITLPESGELGKIIQAHQTVANAPDKPEADATEVDPLSGTEAGSVVKELQQRIHNLQALEDGTELRGEVTLLKEMITKNGEACRYLLNEDLGLFVRALRRMTDNKVAQDMGRAKPKAQAKDSTPKLSAVEVAGLLDELDLSL